MSSNPRAAIVTGAARGLGAAVAVRLAAEGWLVLALDACADDPAVGYPLGTPEQLAEVVDQGGGRILGRQMDVRDADALTTAVQLAEREFGGLDAAVAAAAVIGGGAPLWQTPASVRDAIWAVDVAGVWNLAAAAVPAMLRRPTPRSGRFVAIASSAGDRGLLQLSAYCAAKHAVVGMVKALAQDLRGSGVNASAVSPGSMDTAMLQATAGLYGLTEVAPLADGMPLGRVLEPGEVAAAVCWLCRPESVAVTGSVLHADGGFTA
jgi:SDR family mycofactocin-dependent oxidoreductase